MLDHNDSFNRIEPEPVIVMDGLDAQNNWASYMFTEIETTNIKSKFEFETEKLLFILKDMLGQGYFMEKKLAPK